VILVVGLGNPGPKYAATRHNVGFMVVERLVERAKGGPWQKKFNGEVAQLDLAGERSIALKPHTYMNESGRSVQPAAAFYKVEPANIVVVHDELDLPFRTIRMKIGGGTAGNNGVKSVTQHLGTPDYVRIRVGIGKGDPDFPRDGADFVLDGFPASERADLDEVIDRSLEAVTLFASRGLSAAMNVVNQRAR
jgi:PTH1 family peptidyl-tRNA hydrolase